MRSWYLMKPSTAPNRADDCRIGGESPDWPQFILTAILSKLAD